VVRKAEKIWGKKRVSAGATLGVKLHDHILGNRNKKNEIKDRSIENNSFKGKGNRGKREKEETETGGKKGKGYLD